MRPATKNSLAKAQCDIRWSPLEGLVFWEILQLYHLTQRERAEPGKKPLCSNTDPALKSDQGNGPLSVDAFVKIGNAVAL